MNTWHVSKCKNVFDNVWSIYLKDTMCMQDSLRLGKYYIDYSSIDYKKRQILKQAILRSRQGMNCTYQSNIGKINIICLISKCHSNINLLIICQLIKWKQVDHEKFSFCTDYPDISQRCFVEAIWTRLG